MKNIIRETAEEILQEYTNCYSEADEDCLVEMLEKLASEVAREIFEGIQIRFKELYEEGKMAPFQCCVKAINETEKKYTETEKDDG